MLSHGDNAQRLARNINAIYYHGSMDPSLAPSHGDNLTCSLQKINRILFAESWTNCALASGWTGTLQARLNIDRIEFLGKVSNPAPLTTSLKLVATLPPSVASPVSGRTAMVPGGTSLNPSCSVALIISSNGQINAAAFNSNDNPTIVWFDGISVPL